MEYYNRSISWSFDTRKNYISKLIRPIGKSIFGIFDVMGVRYLFQLRLGLSPLRAHKWNHHFRDITSNKCMCNNGIEDTSHFLFNCSLFTTQRLSLLANVGEILHTYNLDHMYNQPSLYLYGDKNISKDDNKRILMSTIRFLKDSKRFSIEWDKLLLNYPNHSFHKLFFFSFSLFWFDLYVMYVGIVNIFISLLCCNIF